MKNKRFELVIVWSTGERDTGDLHCDLVRRKVGREALDMGVDKDDVDSLPVVVPRIDIILRNIRLVSRIGHIGASSGFRSMSAFRK